MASEKEKQNCKKKVRHPNEIKALNSLKLINPRRVLKRPYRAYKCGACGGYHLTSQPKAR